MFHDPSLFGIEPPTSREKLLLLSLLNETIADAKLDLPDKHTRAGDVRDARLWILGEPDPSGRRRWRLGDFETVCELLGVRAEAVRDSVSQAIAQKVHQSRRKVRDAMDRPRRVSA